MKTVQQEINRLLLQSKTNHHVTASEGGYYHDLCSVSDKTISLEEFYKDFPYHNPDFNSEYWQKQHQKFQELWKQNTI